MGNQSNSPKFVSETQWQTIELRRHDIIGNPSLCQHKNTHIQADLYETYAQADFKHQINGINQIISAKHKNILHYIFIYLRENQNLMCGNKPLVRIFTQKIMMRYKQTDFPQIHQLWIMYEAIKGFEALSQIVNNHFIVTDKMIAFNEKGSIKIWLNQNYGRLMIDERMMAKSQEQMLRSIHLAFVNLVDKYSLRRLITFVALKNTIQKLLSGLDIHKIHSQIQQKIRQYQLPKLIKTSTTHTKMINPIENIDLSRGCSLSKLEKKGSIYQQMIKKSLSPRFNKENAIKLQQVLTVPRNKSIIQINYNPHVDIHFSNIPIQTKPIDRMAFTPHSFPQSNTKGYFPLPSKQLQINNNPPTKQQNYRISTQRNIGDKVVGWFVDSNIQQHKELTYFPKQQCDSDEARYKTGKLLSPRSTLLRNPNKKFSSIIQQECQQQSQTNKTDRYLQSRKTIKSSLLDIL